MTITISNNTIVKHATVGNAAKVNQAVDFLAKIKLLEAIESLRCEVAAKVFGEPSIEEELLEAPDLPGRIYAVYRKTPKKYIKVSGDFKTIEEAHNFLLKTKKIDPKGHYFMDDKWDGVVRVSYT